MILQEEPKWLNEEFGEWVRGLQEKYHIPGTSVAVVDNGRVESAGYGFARLPDVPATADTLYAMASTSKAIAAATMGLVLNDDKTNDLPDSKATHGKFKKMKWITPIVDVLGDDFDMGDPVLTQSVTIEDALSHRSGIAGHDFHYGPSFGTRGTEHTQALRHFNASREHFRTKFQYSNIMYGAVGHILEKIDGGWDAAARKRIFEPLRMNNTYTGFHSPALARNGASKLARGYHWVEEERTEANSTVGAEMKSGSSRGHYVSEGYTELGPIIGPAGSIISCVNDYSKWITALLEAATLPESNTEPPAISKNQPQPAVISHDLWKELITPRTMLLPAMSMFPDVNPNVEDVDINPPLYALGWFSGPYMFTGHTILHHAGGIPGFGTHVFLLPKEKLGIVVASNTHMISNKIAEQIGREIIGRKIGRCLDERRCEGVFAPKENKPAATSTSPSQEEEGLTQPLTADIPSEPTVKEEETGKSDTDGLPDSFAPEAVIGVYEHAAYGRYTVAVADSHSAMTVGKPSLDDIRIVRKSTSSPLKGVSKHANLVLQAEPQGRRTLHHTTLLHPPSKIAKSAQIAEHIFLTLERLWAHGDLMIDPVPGLARGFGNENDPNYPFKQEALWEGGAISANVSCGACFVFKGDIVTRLGMVLGNTQTMEAAMRKGDEKELPLEDFESKMIWFDKIE